jgi:hypothetical protein
MVGRKDSEALLVVLLSVPFVDHAVRLDWCRRGQNPFNRKKPSQHGAFESPEVPSSSLRSIECILVSERIHHEPLPDIRGNVKASSGKLVEGGPCISQKAQEGSLNLTLPVDKWLQRRNASSIYHKAPYH